ncbi:Elongation factor Ts, mitochondrial [Coemansia sp. RSA 1935]|nr:Elongation factor Ts, mitochondrial [Coemansia sp. RSA 551]KAJ2534923.1 Elongation factor Ts, mitochondrial [Coemansia sp. RSA 1935]
MVLARVCRVALRGYATKAAKVDIAALKRLRQLNPVSMSRAKEALISSENDVERALTWLERDALAAGAQKAAKVKDRVAAEGAVAVYVNDAQTAATMVELGCETDFVARNATFVELASRIARVGAAFAGSSDSVVANIGVDALAARALGAHSVSDAVTEAIGRLGENVVLRRVATAGGPGVVVGAYVHGGSGAAGRIGALVALHSDGENSTLAQLARQLAQHVVGFAPRYATHAEWERAGGSGDTSAVLESQVFVFGGGTVGEVLQKASQATGAPVHVAGFIRFVRGEGVVKPARPSFADEVRQQLA